MENYILNTPSPMQSFNEALAFGNNIMQSRAAAAQAQAQAAAAQAAMERQKQIDDLMAKLGQPGATADDYIQLSMLLPKDASESIREGVKLMRTEEQEAAVAESAQIFSAFKAGRPDVASGLIRKQAEAERSAGNEQGAKLAETWAQMIDEGEMGAQAVETLFGYNLALLPGGDKAIEAANKYSDERRKAQEQPILMQQKAAELAKATSDAEVAAINAKYAERLKLAELGEMDAREKKAQADAEKARLEAERPDDTKIDESARKVMNSAVETAIGADLVASQAENLANEFDKLRPKSGWTGSLAETLKKVAGGQDKYTSLRQEYVRLRNTDVLKNLPPGVASDKDIEIALKAFPDESANPDQVSAFLRGMAKLQRYTAATNKAKAEWVNYNGSLGPARAPFTVNGITINKGMPFWDFTKSIAIPNTAGGVAAGGVAAAAAPAGTPAATAAPAASGSLVAPPVRMPIVTPNGNETVEVD